MVSCPRGGIYISITQYRRACTTGIGAAEYGWQGHQSRLVRLAFIAANELCDAQGTSLSESFGNFDRVVALGWLLGDAVGAPLLSRKDTHKVGLKARRDAGAIKAEQATNRRTYMRKVSKLKDGDLQLQQLAAEMPRRRTRSCCGRSSCCRWTR